ncbi:MAG: alpha/beta fold hydrolase [Micromonosporaceae bacterium]
MSPKRAGRLTGLVLAAVLAAAIGIPASPGHADAVAHYSGTLADGATWIGDVPSGWNGTLLLFSHGFGPLVAQDAPTPDAATALLGEGFALAGSSYAPGSWWALGSAESDQFATIAAFDDAVGTPRRVISVGESMGGLVNAEIAADGAGRVDGALNLCGLVAGGADLNNYQLNAEYAISALLAPGQDIQLLNLPSAAAGAASGNELAAVVQAAQASPQGRARVALASALLNQSDWAPGQAPPEPADYDGQEAQQYDWLIQNGVFQFIQFGRYYIELAAGGDSSSNAGVDYARLLRHSAHLNEVLALYREAGLSLGADLATLDRGANVHGSRNALQWMLHTSVPTGRLTVPLLDLHTIADQLVPVEQENQFAARVRAAGAVVLFRQAYVKRQLHCNFTTAEIVAGVHATIHRVRTGHWDDAATPQSLQREAEALNLGGAAFMPYRPAQLVVQAPLPVNHR